MERKLVKKELIEKGWSNDKKYCVTDENGEKYLLRISSIEQLEYKKAEFENMNQIFKLGIPMCEPIEFGICDEGVYSLQSWIEGKTQKKLFQHFLINKYMIMGSRQVKSLKSFIRFPHQKRWKIGNYFSIAKWIEKLRYTTNVN